MQPRRMLIVTDEMEVGGSQRQISHLLAGLDRTRWQPELLFFRTPSFLVDRLRDQGITVHHLPKRGRLDVAFVLRYAKLLRQQRYVLVHAFSLTAELWTLVARLPVPRRVRLVASVRGLYLTEPDWFWRIKRIVVGGSSAVIANARAGAMVAAARMRMPIAAFDVVPNGVVAPEPMQADRRTELRSALGAPANRALALFVGRLVTEKDLPCLLRALARIPEHVRPWLALVGDGPLRAELESLRDRAGLGDDVCFLGPRTDTMALMQCADFLALPSSSEGMSNVLMEAMMSGCAVVASDAGGNCELVEDERTGLLFKVGDDLMLSRHLERMASNGELRSRLSARAREQMQRQYSMAAMLASTSAIYERCLADPASEPVRELAMPDASIEHK